MPTQIVLETRRQNQRWLNVGAILKIYIKDYIGAVCLLVWYYGKVCIDSIHH